MWRYGELLINYSVLENFGNKILSNFIVICYKFFCIENLFVVFWFGILVLRLFRFINSI